MPRPGRRPDLDRKIAGLLAQLRAALVAREQQRVEERVASQIDALVRGLRGSGEGADASPATAKASPAGPTAMASTSGNTKRRGVPSPGRARQIAAMKAYWAAKRAGKRTAGAKA